MAPNFDRITVEPDKCGGQPCIRGMRITARRVLELMASYPDCADLLRDYPYLEEEDLVQSAAFAAARPDLISAAQTRDTWVDVLDAIRDAAAQNGLDQITMEEIDAEIADCRRSRREQPSH